MCFCCFFCKQKTAYEMRISDWSSDVCSSDLRPAAVGCGAESDASEAVRPFRMRPMKPLMLSSCSAWATSSPPPPGSGRCGNPSRPRRMTRPQSCAGSEPPVTLFSGVERSEERRVGKEWSVRLAHGALRVYKKKQIKQQNI